MKSIIEELKGRFDGPFGSADKEIIEKLYLKVCGKVFRPTSCQNCYHDAFLEIVNYIRNNGKMAEKCNFRLKAGAIIHSPSFENGKIFVNENLTDELAAKYLAMFPGQIVLFQKVPEGFKPGDGVKKEVPTLEEAEEMKVKAETLLKGAETRLQNAEKKVKESKDEKSKAKAEKAAEAAKKAVEKAQKGLDEVNTLIEDLKASETDSEGSGDDSDGNGAGEGSGDE